MDGFQIAPQRPWWRPPPWVWLLGGLIGITVAGILWVVLT
jgi:hypothetical protein